MESEIKISTSRIVIWRGICINIYNQISCRVCEGDKLEKTTLHQYRMNMYEELSKKFERDVFPKEWELIQKKYME